MLSTRTIAILSLVLLGSCVDNGGRENSIAAESCMSCHNGAAENDYTGPGLEDPHPFGSAANIRCTTCHGGNAGGDDKDSSHVPPPPAIGDYRDYMADNVFDTEEREAYFNLLTRAGLDKYADYTVGAKTYSALDYLQFIAPSDLRVLNANRSCNQCHGNHVDQVTNSLLASEAGILSSASYAIGIPNAFGNTNYEDTAADMGFRDASDPNPPGTMGAVAELMEMPVYSARDVFTPGGNNKGRASFSPLDMRNNPNYDTVNMRGYMNPDNTAQPGSPLAKVVAEQFAFTCGDCHLGSSGANNRYGDFRPSGCAACHMRYSLSGKSLAGDPNLDPNEPLNPDDIEEDLNNNDLPQLPHVRRHLIQSVAKTLPSGEMVQGIDDYSCAGCHQGSNRTVMQYWGIRLDQNQDVRRNFQYPANPATYRTTSGDTRLFDPVVDNNTFNGRNRNQYLLEEDYDADGRDDTPPDVHYEAGMGCIDCHGSYDLHGGDVAAAEDTIHSRMEQSVAIRCETCHGAADAYANVQPGADYADVPRDLAVDAQGNQLKHVYRDTNGDFWLRSRLTGDLHYVPQTLDTVFDNGKNNPISGLPVYSPMASYAMGRDDGNPATGIGPRQASGGLSGFTHATNVSCTACHASWTNSCVGCHLEGEYNNGANFSNITGERIVFNEEEAQFVYQSPVLFQLGIGPDNMIDPIAANSDFFFRWKDRQNVRTGDLGEGPNVFVFSDRNGGGNAPAQAYPSLSHNVMMPHSIRGRVTGAYEGPRYCVACHLTDDAITNFGTEYTAFRNALAIGDFGSLNYGLLQTHIGRNTGNQLNSPFWVHMVAGLGTGLFLFDEDGCAVNPLDNNPNRYGCDDENDATNDAPSNNFDPARVVFDLDRIVNPDGTATGANAHPMLNPGGTPHHRQGAINEDMSGPLGMLLIQRLVDPAAGIVLDAWIDANGVPQGNASDFLP